MVLKDKIIKGMDHDVWTDLTSWCTKHSKKVSYVVKDLITDFLKKEEQK
jgi:hypothetical protein